MAEFDPLPDDSGIAEGDSTFALPEFELHRVVLLAPEIPSAPESEYGRRDCLRESERFRGKFEELFPRECRPQTGGGTSSNGGRPLAHAGNDTQDDTASQDTSDDSGIDGADDVPGEPLPPPKKPEDADCSCSVPDFLATSIFKTIGTSESELLRGTAIDGRGGNDTLQAGDGADVLSGGDGNDILEPGNGNDSVSGGSGDDIVNGGPDNDIVLGGQGDDLVNGGPGNDIVCGESGRDTVSGGDGNDCASGGSEADTVNGGAGNDTIHGDAGDDFLLGREDDDWIFGGTGNDYLRGDEGFDTLIGGDGNDIFYFGLISGQDEVRDFTPGADRLDMRGMGLSSWALVDAHVDDTAAGIVIEFDNNQVLLRGVHTIAASDFLF